MSDRDEDMYRQYSRKNRSASVCLANTDIACSYIGEKVQREGVNIPVTKYGSGNVSKTYDSPVGTPSGNARHKQRHAARRSKSDRIHGQNRPLVQRRTDGHHPLDLAAGSDLSGTEGSLQQSEEQSYNPFLLKMPSTSRLTYDNNGGGFNDTPDATPPTSRRAKFSSITITQQQSSDITTAMAGGGQRSSPGSGAKPSLVRHASSRNPADKSPACRMRQVQLKRTSSTRQPATNPPGGAQQKIGPKYGYLGIPDGEDPNNFASGNQFQSQAETEDSLCIRSFSYTSKGLVNRGDSFRKKRNSDCRSLQAIASNKPVQHAETRGKSYRVTIVGVPGVGKTALLSQFMTSESINAYDRQKLDDDGTASTISVMLNGEESELFFTTLSNMKTNLDRKELPDALVMVYSVVDKASFTRVEDELARLRNWDVLKNRAVIVVANKIDLARSRVISTQDGKCLACAYETKFTETSVAINHNVDELLVGILKQIRIKESFSETGDLQDSHTSTSWLRSKSLTRASMKAKQMLTWVFGKDDDQFKNCENLQIP